MIITTDKIMRARNSHDFYPTPLVVCGAALNLLPDSFQPGSVFDPGAGTGVWGVAARWKWITAEINGMELRREAVKCGAYDFWAHGDYLSFPFGDPSYDTVIGNPPYALAEQFIRKSLALTRCGGYVVFLLRLAFLEGQARARGLWRDFPPQQVHVLSARPSFMPEDSEKAGKTDATAYAIFIWQKGWRGQPSLGWLDWKPQEQPQPTLFDMEEQR